MILIGGNGYFQTRRGSSNAATTILAFAILLMLNGGNLSLHGRYQMMHYLSFAYMLNGSFMILHGLIGDMEFTRKFLATYYGAGGLMFLISGIMSLSNSGGQNLLAVAIGVLGIIEGLSMAVLALCVKMLVTG
ncbi:uncharacterized protein LOC142813841 [Rhipicephalus microplus]|uniref:uncharacterized protein LOC142813841 n=1 Tax=Rhipicephalus microplus TaxID=6941 RepID=UPI003F6B3A2B